MEVTMLRYITMFEPGTKFLVPCEFCEISKQFTEHFGKNASR